MNGSTVLYLEPVGGIAGDMFLAAMLDLGVDPGQLEAGLRTLGLEGWGFEVSRAVLILPSASFTSTVTSPSRSSARSSLLR